MPEVKFLITTSSGSILPLPMIISKGQGNFEALSDTAAPVFFLLVVKCPILARDIGVNVGDMVLKGPSA
jgi:hypothetical protein